MIINVGTDEGSDAVAAPVAVPGASGVVARPGLFLRLGGPARVTVVSAPAGSGKTVLLRSWISHRGLEDGAAWVAAGRAERDAQGFWLSAVGALRRMAPGLVQALTAAPDLDGWAIAERLLKDLASLQDWMWLVVDDVHELGPEVLRQLELLIMRAPPGLRFVLASRHDVRLGLHRLRLEGELAEIRADDLRFSVAEAGELFAAAGVELPGPAVASLHERTEGWAAGLRLAALAAARHPDPERFAREFSGTERTVADYLLAEVLDQQPEPVRRLLLRTSILERVNGQLASLLTGVEGGERVLQDLEQANVFMISLDAARTWFRYHQMFAGLLQLELRRTAPGEIAGLQRAAAGWFAGHGYPVEAIRHAQAAGDWELAARLLADHWPGLHLDGQAAVIHELVTGFPAGRRADDAGLAAVAAADELGYRSVAAAGHYLGLAERGMASVPDDRQGQDQLLLGIVRLLVARQRGNLPAVAEAARRLEALAGAPEATQPRLSEELRGLALVSLGVTEYWTASFDEAERHLDRGVALARRIGRPYVEFNGLAGQAANAFLTSFTRAAEHCRQVIELAQRHGWNDQPPAALAYAVLGDTLAWQGRPGEAEPWIQRAERTLRAEVEPATGLGIYYVRGVLELARGQDAEALAAFRAAERLAGNFAGPHFLVQPAQAFLVQTLIRTGDTEGAEQTLARLEDHDRGDIRMTTAMLRLAQGDPHAATTALSPVLDGSAPLVWPAWQAQAFLLEAIARDALGDKDAADQALEHALDLSEPDGVVLWFLLHPVPGLLERPARQRSSHGALIAEIQSILAGNRSVPPGGPQPLSEPLSESEIRVLRYLPTNLTAPEIARELSVSRNTVKTHLRNLYAKLGTHRRAEAVTRARDLGLLAPSVSGFRRLTPLPVDCKLRGSEPEPAGAARDYRGFPVPRFHVQASFSSPLCFCAAAARRIRFSR
jgi:LuxR family maltose regulon positive regulatory protein